MKKMTRYTTIAFSLCCFSFTVLTANSVMAYDDVLIGAATADTNIVITDEIANTVSEESVMLTDTVYKIDLEGDGQTEQIYFTTYTQESDEQGTSNAVLEIYKDGQLYWSCTDPEWSYYWDLGKFTLADGKTYLLANSRSDNDWNSMTLVLSNTPENDTLTVLADLTENTRQTDETPDNPLSGWSRVGYAALLSTKENTVTVPWTDNTKCTGNMTVYVDYEISENTMTLSSATLRLDENRTWTAWYEFDVYKEAGSTDVLFHVAADDVVSLTEMTSFGGQTYLKCVNAKGEEGWFPDAAEYVHAESAESPDGYYQGYFKECIFAG